MAMRFAAAKETTPDAELPLACKYASEDPSGFNKIMDVIHAPAGSDLDQLRWLACQAEPLQEKISAIANEMAAALGVAEEAGDADVMAPFYNARRRKLMPGDIARIRALYPGK